MIFFKFRFNQKLLFFALQMFGIGFSELLVIGIVLIIMYNPTKLPELMRFAAGLIAKFKRTVNDVKYNVYKEVDMIAGKDVQTIRNLKNEVEQNLGSYELPHMLNHFADVVDNKKLETTNKAKKPHLASSALKNRKSTVTKNTKTTTNKLIIKKRTSSKNTKSSINISKNRKSPVASTKSSKKPIQSA